jgi:hypothetical protein
MKRSPETATILAESYLRIDVYKEPATNCFSAGTCRPGVYLTRESRYTEEEKNLPYGLSASSVDSRLKIIDNYWH